jgi:ABC transport system ATP-binding/permease protein
MREAATGVRVDAFLISRCLVLFPVAAFQAVIMLLLVGILQPLGVSGAELMEMLVLCVLTAWAAVALGLLVSAFATSADQATSSVPLVLIPQLLLAGAVIPVAKMIAAMKGLSVLALSRWSFGGLGNALDLDNRLSPEIGSVTGYEPAFFKTSAGTCMIALLLFTALMLSATALVLGRKVRAAEGGQVLRDSG